MGYQWLADTHELWGGGGGGNKGGINVPLGTSQCTHWFEFLRIN